MPIIGVDIGGTKSTVCFADGNGHLNHVDEFKTTGVDETLDKIYQKVETLAKEKDTIIGIACGGPLDIERGLIQEPPNLPGWIDVPIVKELSERCRVPAYLMNDANAGALAEWIYGAGRGTSNMIFLTCGTGMGAGLILDNRLYEGTSGLAGEVGHMRLSDKGPIGYRKAGSFEGWCSGGGLAQAAMERAVELKGEVSFDSGTENLITTKIVAEAALKGDPEALKLFQQFGDYLGRGLAILIDILNPQKIVIGSVFARCEELIRPSMEASVNRECLPESISHCSVVSSELGDHISNYAALSVARYRSGKFKNSNSR